MLFNTLKFFLFFPFIFLVHWAIPNKLNTWRNMFLVLISYLLYMNWRPAFAIVLLGVTIVTYYGGILFEEKAVDKGFNSKRKLVWVFVILSFLPLLVFKYYNFLNNSLSQGLSALGLDFNLPGLNWAVPVGISFFSFQAVGYMLDVYHGRIKPEKNFFDYVLFVSFFPQIASGPISKASELIPQIKITRYFNYDQAVSGLKYLLLGMFLKVVLADRAGIYVDMVFASYQSFSGLGCALASVLYSIQIYADFAGYSLMAVGIAKTIGFDLVNNFKRPYFANSVSEFWKRWHISLTRWLTEQVYIPLGGSRCSKMRTYWNILVTFIVSGIWHGANWTFIVWGGIHGFFQIIEKHLGWNKNESKGLIKAIRIVLTFTIVTMAWVIFRSATIADAFSFISRYFTNSGLFMAEGSSSQLIYCVVALMPVIIYEILTEFKPLLFSKLWSSSVVRWLSYIIMFSMVLLIGVHDGSSFIYVSF